jgi:hypothetical protein
MSKKNRSNLRRAEMMADHLRMLGFEPSTVDEAHVITWRGGTSEAAKKFYVWVDYSSDVVWLGIIATFDRWANSRDYEFEGIPDDEDFSLLFEIAEECLAKGLMKNEDWTPRNLNEFWRKAKKSRSRREHEAARIHD